MIRSRQVWGLFLISAVGASAAGLVWEKSLAQNFSASTYRQTAPAAQGEVVSDWSSFNALNSPAGNAEEDVTVGEMIAEEPRELQEISPARSPMRLAPAPQQVQGTNPAGTVGYVQGQDSAPNGASAFDGVYAPAAEQVSAPVSPAVYDSAQRLLGEGKGQTELDSRNAQTQYPAQAVYAERNAGDRAGQTVSSNQIRQVNAVVPTESDAQVRRTVQNGQENPGSRAVGAKMPGAEQTNHMPDDFPKGEMAPLDPEKLISFSEVVNLPEGPFQQITIIDPGQKVLCVYHINMGTGEIELKSARKIEWDLQLIFLNSLKPLPQDVQAILKQNQRRR